jgi:hypothetical protein
MQENFANSGFSYDWSFGSFDEKLTRRQAALFGNVNRGIRLYFALARKAIARF